MLKMAWYFKTYTLLKSVHNDLDNADNADDTDDYNRVIGISKCEQKIPNTYPNKCTLTKTSQLDDYSMLSHRLSLKIKRTKWKEQFDKQVKCYYISITP